MPQTIQDTISTYVSDMLAVAHHVANPLETQAEDSAVKSMPETATLIPRIKQTVEGQVQRLEAHLQQIGGNASSGIKNAFTSILGSAASVIDKTRKTRVSKMVRDDQTALALMTVSYTMLHATALGLRDEATAKIAQRGLEELTPLVMELNKIIPAIVIAELREDGHDVDTTAVQSSRETTQKAWN